MMTVSKISVLLFALAALGRAKSIGTLCIPSRLECGPETSEICPATTCTNQTLLTPANSDVPKGTYIATSLTGALELADYLDAHPNVNVTHLLISDSTIEDLETDFGYGDDDYYVFHRLVRGNPPADRVWVDYTPLNRNISRLLAQTILDLDAVSMRILDRVAPSLESLSYLNYIRIWTEDWRVDVPDNRTRTVLDRAFPRLTHLTLRDHHWRFQYLAGRRTFFRPLPSLTHLHVVSSFFPQLSVVRKSVPNATHIRFSGNLPKEFSASRMFLVQWARSMVNVLAASPQSPLIIAQPQFSPMLNRGTWCGNPGIEHSCMLARLARNRDIHLSLPAREDYDEYGVAYDSYRLFPLRRAVAEFVDRIGGGEGEWAVPPSNDTLKYSKMSLRHCY